MWNESLVELALFRWPKWRRSVIGQWAKTTPDLQQLPLDELKALARRAVETCDLPANHRLDVYWLCCVDSDYRLDRESSFDNIVVPNWLPLMWTHPHQSEMQAGGRWYPPQLWSDNDISYQQRRYGVHGDAFTPREHSESMLLAPDHELRVVIDTLKGRPKKQRRVGRPPNTLFSDRIAVKSAVMASAGLSREEIINEISQSDERYWGLEWATVTRLAQRGRRLLADVDKH